MHILNTTAYWTFKISEHWRFNSSLCLSYFGLYPSRSKSILIVSELSTYQSVFSFCQTLWWYRIFSTLLHRGLQEERIVWFPLHCIVVETFKTLSLGIRFFTRRVTIFSSMGGKEIAAIRIDYNLMVGIICHSQSFIKVIQDFVIHKCMHHSQ